MTLAVMGLVSWLIVPFGGGFASRSVSAKTLLFTLERIFALPDMLASLIPSSSTTAPFDIIHVTPIRATFSHTASW